MPTRTPLLALTICATTLAACSEPTGTGGRTLDGAVIGGALGAIIGSQTGKKTVGNAALGAVIGATIGGTIGQELDRQEAALRASLDSDQVGVVNTGSELVVTLPEAITFDTGQSYVRDSLRNDLAALSSNLNEFPNTTVDVIGHTDNVGAASFNQELSARRAESVSLILTENGVASGRQRAFGRGEDEPKATNLTPEGRAANRRVELIIRPLQ